MSDDSQAPKDWLLLELPLMEYGEAWDLQSRLVAAKSEGGLDRDILIILEHTPVFTLGRQGNREHLRVKESFLRSKGVSLFHVERGGDVTYHGPGQIVCYPVVNLRATGWRVAKLVEFLEEIMIRTAMDWGIDARRRSINRGVWVGKKKLGSIGIAVRRGVSFHGLALNVNTSLEPFSWIDPCGLEGVLMTSMEQALGREIPMEKARASLKAHVQELFNITFQTVTLNELEGKLDSHINETG
jgi:lipoate-protein ligase B